MILFDTQLFQIMFFFIFFLDIHLIDSENPERNATSKKHVQVTHFIVPIPETIDCIVIITPDCPIELKLKKKKKNMINGQTTHIVPNPYNCHHTIQLDEGVVLSVFFFFIFFFFSFLFVHNQIISWPAQTMLTPISLRTVLLDYTFHPLTNPHRLIQGAFWRTRSVQQKWVLQLFN